jgi:ribosomal protein L34E
VLATLKKRDETGSISSREDLDKTPGTSKTKEYEIKTPTTTDAKACSLCGVTFETVEDQRSHIRSDLHRYNLKQRLRGITAVSEREFENLIAGGL